jgi:hypothetical protein
VRPALVSLDGSHLLVVLAQPVSNGSKLSAAVLDVTAPGTVTLADVPMSASIATSAGRPSAARVDQTVYLSWESAAGAGAAPGQHLWLKAIPWNGSLDWSQPEIPLARDLQRGDQERVALCAASLPPQGGLLGAWVDYGQNFGNAKGEIAVELSPLPMKRLN